MKNMVLGFTGICNTVILLCSTLNFSPSWEGRLELVVKCEHVMESASTDLKEGIIFSISSVTVEVAALSKIEHIRNLEMNLDGKEFQCKVAALSKIEHIRNLEMNLDRKDNNSHPGRNLPQVK